jgi:hypothetical protein
MYTDSVQRRAYGARALLPSPLGGEGLPLAVTKRVPPAAVRYKQSICSMESVKNVRNLAAGQTPLTQRSDGTNGGYR